MKMLVVKLITTALIVLGTPTSVSAVSGWLNDANTGCRAWIPEIETSASVTWTGECDNGFVSGGGVLRWFDENNKLSGEYVGYCAKGKMHGNGVLVSRKGNRYAGDFFEGQINGKGTMTFRISGERYVGDFKNGVPHGRGVFFHDEGQIYIGDYVNFEQTGKGILIHPDGSVQAGRFEKGRYLGPK